MRSLADEIQQCRICRDCPRYGQALPQEPKPILQLANARAPICIAGQAPGNQAHKKGRPFDDPSGQRLRRWLGVTEETFYDPSRFAIVPMGFCFPGYDAKGGDLPPRRECRETWHDRIFRELDALELILVIGQHAHRYHLPPHHRKPTLTETVAGWQAILDEREQPAILPLPHPSWRNNGWLRRNPWFEQELLPELQRRIKALV